MFAAANDNLVIEEQAAATTELINETETQNHVFQKGANGNLLTTKTFLISL